MGGFFQIQLTFGMVASFSTAFLLPYTVKKDDSHDPEIESTTVWRWIFLIPCFVALLQFILLLCVFTYDTFKYYEQCNDYRNALESHQRIISESLDSNSNENVPNKNVAEASSTEPKVTYFQLFTARFRLTLFVGIMAAVFLQMSGMNSISFYSNVIFTQDRKGYDAEYASKMGNFALGIINFISAILALFVVSKFGRKTILI